MGSASGVLSADPVNGYAETSDKKKGVVISIHSVSSKDPTNIAISYYYSQLTNITKRNHKRYKPSANITWLFPLKACIAPPHVGRHFS